MNSQFVRVLKYGGALGVVGVVSSNLVHRENKYSLSAKSKDVPHPYQQQYPSFGSWDSNWDKRDAKSMVKPLKENATDEEKAAYEEKIKANTSKATRILVLVRHGQYNLKGENDGEKYLTELGRKQADFTGQRLALLYNSYLQRTDVSGKV